MACSRVKFTLLLRSAHTQNAVIMLIEEESQTGLQCAAQSYNRQNHYTAGYGLCSDSVGTTTSSGSRLCNLTLWSNTILLPSNSPVSIAATYT